MSIDFGPEGWQRIRQDYGAWWAGRLDRPLVCLMNVTDDGKPASPFAFGAFLTDLPQDTPPEQMVEMFVDCQSRRRYVGDSFPYFFVNFGAGVLAAMLGSKLNARPETVWFEPIEGADVGNLRVDLDAENFWYRRIKEITRVAAEMIGDQAQVSFTDMGGNLDVLASLVGTESLLMAVLEAGPDVLRCSREITEAWLKVYDDLYELVRPHCAGSQPWASTWAPGRTYMLQSDFSYMISPDMFAEFVVPDLTTCCERIEYPFYHLDGVGELPHVDHLLGIEKLRGIQWIPGDGKPPAQTWCELYDRIRRAGKLVQLNLDARGTREICEQTSGRGILFSVWDCMTVQQARAFVDEIYTLGDRP